MTCLGGAGDEGGYVVCRGFQMKSVLPIEEVVRPLQGLPQGTSDNSCQVRFFALRVLSVENHLLGRGRYCAGLLTDGL